MGISCDSAVLKHGRYGKLVLCPDLLLCEAAEQLINMLIVYVRMKTPVWVMIDMTGEEWMMVRCGEEAGLGEVSAHRLPKRCRVARPDLILTRYWDTSNTIFIKEQRKLYIITGIAWHINAPSRKGIATRGFEIKFDSIYFLNACLLVNDSSMHILSSIKMS